MRSRARRPMSYGIAGALTVGRRLLAFSVLAAPAFAAPPAVPPGAYETIAGLYEYDRQLPLDAQIVKRDESAPAYLRDKVVFTGSRGDRVPAWLMLPKAGARPFPVVVILDGWMGTKDRWWDDDTWPQGGRLTKALAAEGIAALVLDTQFHGERNVGYRPVEELVCDTCANIRREMIVETVADYRRGLDYLATRPEIDRARVGAIGFSMGGVMTYALAAVDDRIRTAVTCVTPVAPDHPRWSAPVFAPRTFVPHVRIPVLQLMGRTDELYSRADADAIRDALASAEKPLEWFDSGHRLPPDYVPRAVGWLREHLK